MRPNSNYIQHGVALARLSANQADCSNHVDEFYCVVFNGAPQPERFTTYAAAFECCERMWDASKRR